MLNAIFGALPDWAVSIIAGAMLWYGANYLWLAPGYFEKVARAESCYGAEIRGDLRSEAAMYTATLGIIGAEGDIIKRACGK